MKYCAWCGAEDPTQPCCRCGRSGTTETAPSQEPCAYCGARPTWGVVYEIDGHKEMVYLCGDCDQQEEKMIDEE